MDPQLKDMMDRPVKVVSTPHEIEQVFYKEYHRGLQRVYDVSDKVKQDVLREALKKTTRYNGQVTDSLLAHARGAPIMSATSSKHNGHSINCLCKDCGLLYKRGTEDKINGHIYACRCSECQRLYPPKRVAHAEHCTCKDCKDLTDTRKIGLIVSPGTGYREVEVPLGCTLQQFLTRQNLLGREVAVDGCQVASGLWKDYCLNGAEEIWVAGHLIPEPTPLCEGGSLVDRVQYLIEEHTLDKVLEAIVVVLKQMKNPEYLAFTLYLFAKRALREITKGVKHKELEARYQITQDE